MSQKEAPPPPPDWTRREFIHGATTLVSAIPLAATLPGCMDANLEEGSGTEATGPLARTESLPTPQTVLSISLLINGTAYPLQVEPRATLNAVIRETLGLTGTKLGCDRAACGACTVLLDGTPVLSCTLLAVEAEGHTIATIESLAKGNSLHPIQQAFIDNDALQCGFCTSGMIMSCKALLDKNLNCDEADVREATAGNLCRCGTYPHVFQATLQAATTMKGG